MAEQKEEKEIGKNCAGCKKPLKRARRYYRNGDYFCNLNCFKKKQEKGAEGSAEDKG
ncbi:MAG TPA: hypothetical protein PLH56_05205 [Candidatus Omnitrophota bacterium]|nr:hypothetical protein [Candidatus Omnitrophota bacterium]